MPSGYSLVMGMRMDIVSLIRSESVGIGCIDLHR